MNYEEQLRVARSAAEAGGEVVARHFREGTRAEGKHDAGWNLVSEADLQSERAIVETIRAAFPDHEILGEEEASADVDAENLWVVDPLDGTNNFAHGIPHFAVSIAFRRNGESVVGIVFNPVTGDWYTATKGGGAFADSEPARVAEHTSLEDVFVGIGFYYDRGAMMEATLEVVRDLFRARIHGIRRFGTASLDLVHVGLGRFGAFVEYELSPWDFAAGELFVTEAGGTATSSRGEPLPLAKSGIIASNGRLHKAVLEIARRHHP